MDGKTKGLIIGDGFIVEEHQVTAARFQRIGTDEYCSVMLTGGGQVCVAGQDSMRLFRRVSDMMKKRHRCG